MNTEEWRDIKGYEGLYQVSNLGRVKSFRQLPTGKIMRLSYHTRGYQKVDLNGKTYFVHRLVAEAFIDEIPDGMEVNHINAILDDNRLENLEIVTPTANIQHARENDLWNKAKRRKPIQRKKIRRMGMESGVWTLQGHIDRVATRKLTILKTPYGNPKGTLSEDDVKNIKILIKSGSYTLVEIGKMFGVERTIISFIKSGKRWKHVEID